VADDINVFHNTSAIFRIQQVANSPLASEIVREGGWLPAGSNELYALSLH